MKKRHMDGKPYTRTGDIIIAVNPFQWFTELYTEKKRTYYSGRLVWNEDTEHDPRDGMEPHVYEVSSLTYKGLAFGDGGNQSILVSGESGAGKTETVKIAMNHIASVQQGPKKLNEGTIETLDPVVQRVVESNPLLEAFGNASTRRNDNSSRFGKYLQLQFDRSTQNASNKGDKSKSHCILAGSKCDVYLLEKNRVTGHDAEGERTYHIFYQVIAAPESDKSFWPHLKGKKYADFKYVQATHILKIEGMTDQEFYLHTVKVLKMIGVDGAKLEGLLKAICIVMQCGNLTFGAKGGDAEASEITSPGELKLLAELMEVTPADLTLAFTERTMKTKTESYKVPLKPDGAKDACDAFAKEVYGKVFLWLVREINLATCAEDNYKNGTMANYDYGIIGLLDIFGFESFVINRFEQLCINYANEKLQQKFTEDVFQAVQREYEAEGIALAEITYDDNTDVLDLIEGRTGLLAMLNEECVRPKGSDEAFVQKALTANKNSSCLITNNYNRMSFGIHHYAGKVMYDADEFVARNQDTLPTDLEEIGFKSKNPLVSAKMEDIAPAPKETGGGGGEKKRSAPKRQKSNLVAPTVWGKYKTQLASLMGNLRITSSRYIRCIKPNMAKKPVLMEHIPTVEQLRCAGVVAAVTLARSAFPNRLENAAIRLRYGSMWDKNRFPSKKTAGMTAEEGLRCDCEAILACALECKETKDKTGKTVRAFVVGLTKSYFRAGALEYLEANRKTGLDAHAVPIQRIARGMLTRMHMKGAVSNAIAREKEERERMEEENRMRREEAERLAAEREIQRKSEYKKFDVQIVTIKRQLQDAEHNKEKRLTDANERKEIALKEIETLKESTGEDARKSAMEPKKIHAQQKKKLEEQVKVIEILKKENKKVRKENEKWREKFSVVKKNNDKLMKANEEAGNEFENTDEAASKVHEKNEKLLSSLETAKSDNKVLKEDCAQRQDDYMTMAETRLEFQKTMARILNMIQDTSKDASLIEDTVCLALECEAEAKQVMAALEAETE
jgi:myosin-5